MCVGVEWKRYRMQDTTGDKSREPIGENGTMDARSYQVAPSLPAAVGSEVMVVVGQSKVSRDWK